MPSRFLLVRATDKDGNPVVLLVNPATGEAIPIGPANQQAQEPNQQPQHQQAQLPTQQPSPQPPTQLQARLQPQQHMPQKAIGHPQTEVLPSVIVFNARGASLQGGKLILAGVSPSTILFADHPVRAAGQDLTAHIIDDWANGGEHFADDPPSATVSGYTKDGTSKRDAVVVLKTPKLNADQLTFDVDILEGDLTGADGPAAVFIDTSDRLATAIPTGVEHHAARRAAWYGAGAGPMEPDAANTYACGRYPYPPCY
jgi:hypothetical protein